MKDWKTALVDKVVQAAESDKIIGLREQANECGINHIARADVVEIMTAVLRRLPEYRAVEMVTPGRANESLFCTLQFVQNDVTFDEAWL